MASRTRQRTGPAGLTARLVVVVYLFLLVAWPVSIVVQRAFDPVGQPGGVGALWERLSAPDAVYAFYLTLTVAFWAVVINTLFGVGISLLLVRQRFRGRRALSVLVDLPMSVSPVVVGLALVLTYSTGLGWFGSILSETGVRIIGSTPGLIMATAFVSLPLVIREVVPVLQEIGTEQEQAANSLGASGWQTFWRITLPSIKWAVIYGVVLTLARSLGEFGAVKVVSGNILGETRTTTLAVEEKYLNFDQQGAYALSFLLASVSVISILVVFLLRARGARVTETRSRTGAVANSDITPIGGPLA